MKNDQETTMLMINSDNNGADGLFQLLPSIRKAGIITALVMAAIGALALFAPAFTSLTVAWLTVGGFTIYGVYKVISYFSLPRPLRSGLYLADGLLSAFLGGMILWDALKGPAGQAGMIATLSFAAGFYALFNGISQTADYFMIRKSGIPGTGFLLASGLLRSLVGILILANPFLGWFSLQLCFGAFLLITGIALFFEALSLKTSPEDL